MNKPVFVVSEWLAKPGFENELQEKLKHLLLQTKRFEKGCIRAHVTKQINHPGSPGKSKYTIVLLQEYENISAFDLHCNADYVKEFYTLYIDNKLTAIVEEFKCRLFTEID